MAKSAGFYVNVVHGDSGEVVKRVYAGPDESSALRIEIKLWRNLNPEPYYTTITEGSCDEQSQDEAEAQTRTDRT